MNLVSGHSKDGCGVGLVLQQNQFLKEKTRGLRRSNLAGVTFYINTNLKTPPYREIENCGQLIDDVPGNIVYIKNILLIEDVDQGTLNIEMGPV